MRYTPLICLLCFLYAAPVITGEGAAIDNTPTAEEGVTRPDAPMMQPLEKKSPPTAEGMPSNTEDANAEGDDEFLTITFAPTKGQRRKMEREEIKRSQDIPNAIRIPDLGPGLRLHRSFDTDNAQAAREVSERLFELDSILAPQAIYAFGMSSNEQESINSHTAAFSVPLDMDWRLSGSFLTEQYTLEETGAPTQESSLFRFDLGLHRRIDKHWTVRGNVLGYHSGSIASPGIGGGAQWNGDRGPFFSLDALLWAPWGSNTTAVAEDGRRHELTGFGSIPLWTRLQLSGDFSVARAYTASGPLTVDQTAGTEVAAGTRMDLMLWNRYNRNLPGLFYDQTGRNQDSIDTSFSVYSSFRASRFYLKDGFSAIAVTDKSYDLRLGVSWQLAFNRHFGLSGSAYIGGDQGREIPIGKLYGGNARIYFIPTNSIRVWLGVGTDSESGNGIAGGATNRLDVGGNFVF